jgi:hypothetical protein
LRSDVDMKEDKELCLHDWNGSSREADMSYVMQKRIVQA